MSKQEKLEQAAKNAFKGEYICNGIDIVPAWREGFVTGAKWQAEKICDSEFIQLIRATKSNAEARRLIFETFKNE